MPNEIMHKTRMYKSHTSRELKTLTLKKLIKCINPDAREFKFYRITPLGKKALGYLNRINNCSK